MMAATKSKPSVLGPDGFDRWGCDGCWLQVRGGLGGGTVDVVPEAAGRFGAAGILAGSETGPERGAGFAGPVGGPAEVALGVSSGVGVG